MPLAEILAEKDSSGYLPLRLRLKEDRLRTVFIKEPKWLPWSKKLQERMLKEEKTRIETQEKTAKKIVRARGRRDAVVPGYNSIKLDGSEFRLLRLFSGRPTDSVHCELFKASLQKTGGSQDYIALSYTWGSEDKIANISVDGEQRKVRKNLARALSALRREDKDLILWVDALCIDQLSFSERNHQVTLMAQIYHQAEEVYIYLGETSRKIGLAMQIMQEAEDDKEDPIHREDRYHFSWSTDEKDYGKLAKLRSNSDAQKGLWEMLERPWFSRVWILQEVAHARSSRIFCGTHSISTKLFRKVPEAAQIIPEAHVRAVLDIMQGASRRSGWGARNQDIAYFLKKFRSSKATNERDKVYALLSMSSDAFDSEYLRPAYQECVGCVVYTTITFILGYHRQEPILEPFLGWNFNQMVDSLDDLSRRAVEWGFETKQLVVLETLLPRYTIRLDKFEGPDELTKNMTKYMIETRNSALFNAIMDRYYPMSRSQGTSTPSRLPNLAMNWAIQAGNAEAVIHLIQLYHGKENQVDYWNQHIHEAMLWALKEENRRVVKEILKRYENCNEHYYSEYRDFPSPEVLAAKFGDMELLQMVLEKSNKYFWPLDQASLQVAYDREDYGMILLLLDDSYVQKLRPMQGNLFHGPLSWAGARSFKNLQWTFLSSWNEFFDPSWEPYHLERLLDQDVEIDLRDYAGGRTPFMKAIEEGQTEIAYLLKDRGADVNAQDKKGETALSNTIANFARQKNWGISEKSLIKTKKMVVFLLANGANPNFKTRQGRVLLHVVIKEGLAEIVEILLSWGADLNFEQQPLPLLHHAAANGRALMCANFLTDEELLATISVWDTFTQDMLESIIRDWDENHRGRDELPERI